MTLPIGPARWTDATQMQAILAAHVTEAAWVPQTRSAAEDLAALDTMITAGWVRLVRADGRIQGFCAKDGDLIQALYVSPSLQGRGVGSQLIEDAKRDQSSLRLWTAAQNTRAQGFYARHGFAQVSQDGTGRNDEGVDEIWLAWQRAQEDT